MEREILIANTKTQKRSKITTSATTLGELKNDLRAAGIDFSNMTFTEGISKTQLLSDDTQLPQNVMYKGQPTNNLVILLTNTKKNIASGAPTRQELYAILKQHGLQDAIKTEFGKNFTQVTTLDLTKFIEANVKKSEAPKNEPIEQPKNEFKEFKESKEPEILPTPQSVIPSVVDSLSTHINSLFNEGVLDVFELQKLERSIHKLTIIMSGEQKDTNNLIDDDDIDDIIDDFDL